MAQYQKGSPTYSDWSSLINGMNAVCKIILSEDVAPVATEILKRHIEQDIYGAYTPAENGWVGGQTYERRNSLLNSPFHKRFVGKNEILITSSARPSPPVIKGSVFEYRQPGAFLEMIERGNMGIWKKGFPRPAVSNAQNEINNSSEILRVIEHGISIRF